MTESIMSEGQAPDSLGTKPITAPGTPGGPEGTSPDATFAPNPGRVPPDPADLMPSVPHPTQAPEGNVGGGQGTPSSDRERSQPPRELTEERKTSIDMVKEIARERKIPPEELAKSSAREGFEKDETREMLKDLYGDDVAKNVMENEDVENAFKPERRRQEGEGIQVHPAPNERDEEVQAGVQALQQMQDMQAKIASGKATKEEGKALVENIKKKGLNWEKLGKYTLYGGVGTLVGSILIFILLLSWHGGGGGR